MKKLLALVVAIAMISTLAITVGATVTMELGSDNEFNFVHVAGSAVRPKANNINQELIRGIKFTLTIPDFECGPSEEDPDAECNKECVSVSWNSFAIDEGGTGWQEKKFCYKEQQVVDVDLSAYAWNHDTEEGLGYLQVGAANWVEENYGKGSVLVEVLGENGQVLPIGFGTDDEGNNIEIDDTTETPTTPTTPTTPGTGGEDVKLGTGMGGVAVLGAVAVLALGAVAITRRRK